MIMDPFDEIRHPDDLKQTAAVAALYPLMDFSGLAETDRVALLAPDYMIPGAFEAARHSWAL
jgi:hypothetical protein